MATPSLALGIGLQGKPIDRAAFNMQREIGAQKALQRKQERELKELEPFKKQLVDLQSKAYLPAQKELLARETAKVYKYMADNIGNVDQWQLSQMVGELANRSGLYQRNYIEAEKLRNNPKYQHLQPEIEKIFSVSSPEAFNEIGSQNPIFGFSLNELGGLNIQPFEAKSAKSTAQTYINNERGRLFGEPTVETIDGIQKEVYRPREGSFEDVFNFTINDPSTFKFEQSQLFNQLAQSGNLPDLKTPEGQQQFDQMVKDKIANDIRFQLGFIDLKNIPQKRGDFIINNYPQTQNDGILQPYDTDLVVSYGGKEMPVSSYATVSLGDLKRTVPATSKTRNAKGQRVKAKTGSTYNQLGVSYVVQSPTEIVITPSDSDVWNNDELREAFSEYLVKDKSGLNKRVYRFEEGMPIPSKLEQTAVNKGVDIDARVLAWALDANNNWIYEDASGTYQSAYLKESDKDKVAIEAIKNRQKEMRDKVNASKPKRNNPAPAPTNTPKADKPTNSRIENNPSLQKLINSKSNAPR